MAYALDTPRDAQQGPSSPLQPAWLMHSRAQRPLKYFDRPRLCARCAYAYDTALRGATQAPCLCALPALPALLACSGVP